MVNEAEEHASSDAEKRKAIDLRNQGDSLAYQTEKMISELGDKIEDAEKVDVEDAIKALRSALETDDAEAIEKAIESVTEKSHKLAEKLYQAAGAGGAPGGPGAPGPADDMTPPTDGDDDVVDVDFEETT